MATCKGRRKDGTPCRSPIVLGDAYCRAHQDQDMDVLEDYVFGQLIKGTMKDRMTSREEALHIVERAEIGK